MREGNSFPLDIVDSHCSGVEKQIDDMIVQKVDLVHIEKVSVGLSKYTGFEFLLARLENVFEIEGSGDTVLGCTQRQLDDVHGPLIGFQFLAFGKFFAALHAHPLGESGIAVENTALYGHDRGKDLCKRPYGC